MKMASLLKGRMDVFEHFGDDISYWITWATQWDRQIKGKLMEAFPDIGISEDTTALRHGAPLPKSIKFPNGGKLHFFYDKFTPAQKLIGPGTYDCAIANFVSGSGIGSDDMVRAVLNVVKPDGAVILEDRGTRISPYFDELRHVLKAPGGGKVLKNKAKLEVPSFSQWGGEEMLCFGDWKPYLS
jgi:hypothetical protein